MMSTPRSWSFIAIRTFSQVHRAAGRLFAVAQGCIKDADSVLWHGVPSCGQAMRMLRRLGQDKAIIFAER